MNQIRLLCGSTAWLKLGLALVFLTLMCQLTYAAPKKLQPVEPTATSEVKKVIWRESFTPSQDGKIIFALNLYDFR